MANQSEAETVREIFGRYGELGSVRLLMEDLNRRGIRSKVRVAKNGRKSGGNSFFRGALYQLLSNPVYVGEVRHKGISHLGLHWPIVDRELWEKTSCCCGAMGFDIRCEQRNQSPVHLRVSCLTKAA